MTTQTTHFERSYVLELLTLNVGTVNLITGSLKGGVLFPRFVRKSSM